LIGKGEQFFAATLEQRHDFFALEGS